MKHMKKGRVCQHRPAGSNTGVKTFFVSEKNFIVTNGQKAFIFRQDEIRLDPDVSGAEFFGASVSIVALVLALERDLWRGWFKGLMGSQTL